MGTARSWPAGLGRHSHTAAPAPGAVEGRLGCAFPANLHLFVPLPAPASSFPVLFPLPALSPSPGWHLEGPFPPSALPLPHRHAFLSHSQGNAAFPRLGVGISPAGSAAAIAALDPDSIPMAKEGNVAEHVLLPGEKQEEEEEGCRVGRSAVLSPRWESGRDVGMHSGRRGWLTAPGAARDGLAAFPRGFSRQERAQQDRGQIVPARHQYISIYLETSLCATQTVSPKHFISTSGKAQIKAAAGSSRELPPLGCCPGRGNCPLAGGMGGGREAGHSPFSSGTTGRSRRGRW